MNIQSVLTTLPYLFKAGITPFFWGSHGIGKSEVIRQAAKALGDWKCFDFRLNTQADVGDILGLQDFEKDSKGHITSSTHYKPKWLEDCIDFCNENPDKGAIVFFDELNRAARHDMVGPIFQMSIDRRLHIWKFPKNLHIVVASNPNTDDYNVLNLDDKALLDRFCHIKFTPSRKEFFEYARVKDTSSSIIDFLVEQPTFIEDSNNLEQFTVDEYTRPSRRTWLNSVDKLLKLDMPKQEFQETLKGLVGTTAASSFLAAMEKADKPLTAEQVLNKYSKNKTVDGKKVRVKSEYAELVAKFKVAESGARIDLFKVTNENIEAELKKSEKAITKKKGENLVDYLIDLPGDVSASVLREWFILPSCKDFFYNNKFRQDELIAKIASARKKDVEDKEKEETSK